MTLILVSIPIADKAKFTDRQTDAGNDNTPSVWKAKGLKLYYEMQCLTSEQLY